MVEIAFNPVTRNADINAPGTVVNVRQSPTDVSIADVMLHGYKFELDLANINIIPLISHAVDEIYNNEFAQIVAPFEWGVTMKNVTALEPHLIAEWDYGYHFYGIGFTFKSFFYTPVYYLGVPRLSRFEYVDSERYYVGNSIDFGEIGHVFINNMIVYDNETAYVVFDDIDADTLNLAKADFCDNSYEILESWNYPTSYGGHTYEWAGHPQFMVRCKYGSTDCLVIEENWYAEDGEYDDYKLRIHIYDLNNQSMVYNQFLDLSNDTTYTNWWVGYRTHPTIYEDKVIFTAILQQPEDRAEGGENYGYYPTFVIDCTNHTVTRANNYKMDDELIEPWGVPTGAGVDRNTGYYYFIAAPIDADATLAGLVQMNVNSPSQHLHSSFAIENAQTIYQGDKSVYAINKDDNPAIIYSVPNLGVLGSVDNDYEGFAVDETNNRVWVYDDDKLVGADLGGGADEEIAINWAGGSTPFDYETNRFARFFILAGTAYALIGSSTGTSIQRDWYLLKEEIPC